LGNFSLSIDYDLTFESSNSKCPITSQEIVHSDGSPYSGGRVTVSSDYRISIDTSEVLYEDLAVKVSSLDTQSPYLLPLSIRVCGFEQLTLAEDLLDKFYM
jgi:hypothetical protein